MDTKKRKSCYSMPLGILKTISSKKKKPMFLILTLKGFIPFFKSRLNHLIITTTRKFQKFNLFIVVGNNKITSYM